MLSRSFEDRFTGKLDKIDRSEIEAFLRRLIDDKGFLETIFDALDEGIVVASRGLDLIACNRRARQLLHLPAGRRVFARPLLDSVRDPEIRACLRRLADRQPARAYEEIEWVQPSGRRDDQRCLAISANSMQQGEAGADESAIPADVPGVDVHGGAILFILQDITQNRQSEQQRRQIEKLASLATLTAGVAHEIKNPLNSLSIHAQLLMKRIEAAEASGAALEPETVGGSLRVILEETRRLGAVVDDFLQAVRPSRPSMEPRDLNAVARRVAELFGPECVKQGIDLELRLAPDLGEAQFDERQLAQAVINLVKNSVEAIAEGAEAADGLGSVDIAAADFVDSDPTPVSGETRRTRIVLRTRGTMKTVSLSVEDTGPGISEENLQKVFEPYFTTKFHGTGLGLMNVFRVIQEHEGHLDLASDPGKGTNFTLTIPRKAPPPLKLLPDFSEAKPHVVNVTTQPARPAAETIQDRSRSEGEN